LARSASPGCPRPPVSPRWRRRPKSFGDNAKNWGFLARQTQLSVNQLRVFEALGPRIGASVEAMDQSLVEFSSHMERLQRNPRLELLESFKSLGVMPVGPIIREFAAFIKSLEGLSRNDQVGKVVAELDKLQYQGQKRAFLKAFGLPEQFSNLSGKELAAQIEQIKKFQRPLTAAEIEGGKKTADAIANIAVALGNLKDHIGASLAPDLERSRRRSPNSPMRMRTTSPSG
jgi:hypothetical protein